jgi:predicted LPLAT superfamily acyltransferase
MKPLLKRRREGTTYGNARMFKLLISLLRHVPIRVFYVFMAICVIPVTMVLSPGARLTYRYFRRRRGYGRLRSLCDTYRNHCIFGQTVIDKFAMYAGKRFPIVYHGLDLYHQLIAQPEPLILLSAHIGCSEVVGYSIQVSKPCNVLVYGGEKQSLMGYRQASFANMNIKMIPVGTGESHSEDIVNALDNGETISAFADRLMTANKVIISTIHGHKVKLAKGPFSLATTRGLNVMMVSGMKENDGSYTAFITPLDYDKTLSKSEQRQQLADAYTAEVNRLLSVYPLQWFNYSDIWIDA